MLLTTLPTSSTTPTWPTPFVALTPKAEAASDLIIGERGFAPRLISKHGLREFHQIDIVATVDLDLVTSRQSGRFHHKIEIGGIVLAAPYLLMIFSTVFAPAAR